MRHKFRAKQTISDGIKFPSKLEADYYRILKMLEKDGEIVFFLRQVPLHHSSGFKLVIDFQVFWKDGSVTFEDTKGVETKDFKIKRKAIESEYPFSIKIVTRKDINAML